MKYFFFRGICGNFDNLMYLEQKTFHKCQGNIEDVEELQNNKKNGDPANEKYEKIQNSLTWFAVKKNPMVRIFSSDSKFVGWFCKSLNPELITVILKLCAAAQYCAARILKMCREDIEKIQLYEN
jgi:hypothetical protein